MLIMPATVFSCHIFFYHISRLYLNSLLAEMNCVSNNCFPLILRYCPSTCGICSRAHTHTHWQHTKNGNLSFIFVCRLWKSVGIRGMLIITVKSLRHIVCIVCIVNKTFECNVMNYFTSSNAWTGEATKKKIGMERDILLLINI